MIRVVVIEDHKIVRQGLVALLETAEDMQVIGEVGDGVSAVELLERLVPDVVLCDLALPGIGGLEVMNRCAELSCRFIILSMYHDVIWVRRAVEAGAKGYLVKGSGVQDVLKAIRCVAQGESFLSPNAEAAVKKRDLSLREIEILTFVAQGHTSKELSHILKISTRTVEHHRSKIMDKLKIYDVPGLTRYAVRHGYVDLHLK